MYHLDDYSVIGFSNYSSVLTSSLRNVFFPVLGWTVSFAGISTMGAYFIGLGLAILLNNPNMKESKIYKAILIVPWALSATIAILAWQGLLNERYGGINAVLKTIGFEADLPADELKTTFYNYIKTVMEDFKSEGIVPEMVQMGNEILAGMLWDTGKVGWEGFEDFTPLVELLEIGIGAVREVVGHDTKIILHLDKGGNNDQFRWWFESLYRAGGERLDYDIIGLTYYIMWNGTLDELQYNLNYISEQYNKDVLIVETAYGWTVVDGDGLGSSFSEADVAVAGYPGTPQGQIDMFTDMESVLLNVPNGRALGHMYWEPAWILVPGAHWATPEGQAFLGDETVLNNPWDNLTLFDFEGNALESTKILAVPNENKFQNPSFEEDGYVTSAPSGWTVDGDVDAVKTEFGGYDGEWHLTFWKDTPFSSSVYQTFTDLEEGLYTFSFWFRSSEAKDAGEIYIKARGKDVLKKSIEVKDANTWSRAVVDDIAVTSGVPLEFGVSISANANDWVNVDLVMLRKRK